MHMNLRTDARSPDAVSASLATPRKPRVALAIATAFGLGYIPLGPGTWGSLTAVATYFFVCSWYRLPTHEIQDVRGYGMNGLSAVWTLLAIWVLLAVIGLWAADQAANYSGRRDPQFVVVDEVSGQLLTLLVGSVLPVHGNGVPWPGAAHLVLSWKYLLLGFILFRAFDIWKPSPARQAESLPGGLGIMADDWVAGIYAAIGLWIARAAGL